MILNINSRGFGLSEAIRNIIQYNAKKLEKVFPRIHACHYTVEIPHKHHQKGAKFAARIDMSVPGEEIVIKTAPENNLYSAIHSASESARERLVKYVAKKRGSVKAHSKSKLMPPRAEGQESTLYEWE